jgi:hypothetical protein
MIISWNMNGRRDEAPHSVPVYGGMCACTAELPPLQIQEHMVMSEPELTTVFCLFVFYQGD